MRQNNTNPLKSNIPLAVVSDIHFRDQNDDKWPAFFALIDWLKERKCLRFALLGDIFEFNLGGDAFFDDHFNLFWQALDSLRRSGCEIIFIEGNHEFGYANLPGKYKRYPMVSYMGDPRHYTINLNDSAVSLCHGDRLKPDFWYSVLRIVVKSRLASFLARWVVPSRWLFKICHRYASYSRSSHDYNNFPHSVILNCANKWLEQTGSDVGIWGHFHVPYHVNLESQQMGKISKKTGLSLKSWLEVPNVLLIYSRDSIQRGEWNQQLQEFNVSPSQIFSGQKSSGFL